jgi:adenosylmethionine-8-amino-7-oxononanoate aminotransferase
VASASDGSPVLHRDLKREYKEIARGEGVYLFDTNGTRYLDAVGGVAVNIIGHGVREIGDALARNVEETSFAYGAAFSNPWQEELARNLVSISPFSDASVYFTSGGSEANETAVKLARQYHLDRGKPQKWKVVSRWQSYHGNTLTTLGLSGRPSWRGPYDPYIVATPHMASPYCYRCPFGKTYPSCQVQCADDLERTILQEGPETVSAFIAEPVVGTSLAGVVPVPEYYARIREICDEYDVLFIADEVLSGYGRTGTAFAIDHWGVRPDILTLGKGVGSGYVPLAGCIADGPVVDSLRTGGGRFTHGFTYSGMPVSCFIGQQVFDYVQRHNLFQASAVNGAYLHERLRVMAQTREHIGDVRGLGMLAGVELVADFATKQPFPRELAVTDNIVIEAEARGVLLREGTPDVNHGKGGDQIQISPAYIITREQIDTVVDVLAESIDTVVAKALLATGHSSTR